MTKVGIIMGSSSDWTTMQHAAKTLKDFEINYEALIISAHRTPDLMFEYAEAAEAHGLKVIIAGAGGAAHLPGMVASKTIVPVIGVPVASKHLNGQDSLLSIVQMPAGIPVATMSIGDSGAINAALLAISILAGYDDGLAKKLHEFRKQQSQKVINMSLPEVN